MINDTVSYTPVTQPYQYVAHVKKGKIFAAMQNFPPQELTENEFEITSEEFYFLQTLVLSHYTDLRRVRRLLNNIQKEMRKLK